MKKLMIIGLCALAALSVFGQSESDYQDQANLDYFYGVTGVYVDGVYADILTYDGLGNVELAIEVDFTSKYCEGITQALMYAMLTGGRAVLLLIKDKVSDTAAQGHIVRAIRIVMYYMLPIDIYVIDTNYNIGCIYKNVF